MIPASVAASATKAAPYHAIVYIPVPCEESCPVKAISKDEHGIEHIDENKMYLLR